MGGGGGGAEGEREIERDICLFNNKVFGDSQRHNFN